jgi:GGDEF domain-containing protein
MLEPDIMMEKGPQSILELPKESQSSGDGHNTAIQEIVAKTLSLLGYDSTLRLRQGSTTEADKLKRPGIERSKSLKKNYQGAERRKDFQRRKRIEEMTPEEMRRELLTDPLTNLSNKRAYQEDPRLPVQVFVDVDSLKWINDNISHEAGDELLRTVGWALDSLDCPGYHSYHISGDEFIIQAKSVQTAQAAINHALVCLDIVTFEFMLPDGTTIRKKGVGVSYGIATTVELAEEELRKHKVQREAKGLRAARGEIPPGVARGEVCNAYTSIEWARVQADRTRSHPRAQVPRYHQTLTTA